MELIDCHSHTAYSGHGEGDIAQAVARACDLGLAVYAQTEHLTLPEKLDPQRGDSMSPQDARSYLEQLRRLQAYLSQRRPDLQLVAGIEADWLPGRSAELQELCAPYDYVIGSIHFLKGLPLDNEDDMRLWDELGTDGVWELYLNTLEELVRSGAPIQCLGHPDLPKVFGRRPSFGVEDAFADIAQLAATRELIVEVNTAGWYKGAQEQYPAASILRSFFQAGVPCTVGCDAHRPGQIGRGVQEAYRLMFNAGYRFVTAPLPGTAQSGRWQRFELK
ncbi:MAG: histidinol-phosphatase [Coriobacteriales bacterium]